MSGKLFLKNRLPIILLNLLGALALSLFLLAVGNDIQTVLFLLTAWMLVLALYLAAERNGWRNCWKWPRS